MSNNVFDLFDPERYCLNASCRRVDCESHCWSCGTEHDNVLNAPWCDACGLDMASDTQDLSGFWDPPQGHVQPRRRLLGHMSLEDVLRDLGQHWLLTHKA